MSVAMATMGGIGNDVIRKLIHARGWDDPNRTSINDWEFEHGTHVG